MKNLIEKLFKREKPNYNYVVGEYKPSRANAKSKLPHQSDYATEPSVDKDEMAVDNLYRNH